MPTAWITADDLDDASHVEAPEAARAASMLMYQLSGRKYEGIRSVTEFYECSTTCTSGGLAAAIAARRSGISCVSHPRQKLRLRQTPVRSVEELVVAWEGERRVVPLEEVRVIDRAAIRPAQGASWSVCSNLEVTYTGGSRIPEAGLRAARELGNHLLWARLNDDRCALPSRVTSISRQGLSVTVLDPQDFLKDGRTGLYEVDLFLKATNPDNARKRAKVFSPDLPNVGRVTTS